MPKYQYRKIEYCQHHRRRHRILQLPTRPHLLLVPQAHDVQYLTDIKNMLPTLSL